jgi:recombination protein RecA
VSVVRLRNQPLVTDFTILADARKGLSEQLFGTTLMSFVSALTVTPPGDDGPDLVAAPPLLCTGRSPATERLNGEAAKETVVERDKALEMALIQIEKQYGKGSVMKMSDKGEMNIEAIATGALALDLALGVGGVPRGRVVEIFGPESSGKSTLAMHVVAEAQRNGGICAYIDAEHAMDPVYANAIGVDIDELLISQPDTGEQALEITDMLVRSGALDVVVIDSVAALTPRAEIEGEMGDTHVGLQARLMSQALRKLTANLNRTKTICVFINQLREKIGVMFGSPETTPGGRALKFYSSVRLDIRRIESIKDGVEVVGNRTRVKVVKNKVAPPFRQAEFDIMYGKGISREGSLLDVGVDLGFIKKSGAWFTYEGEQLGQGRENAKCFLADNAEIMVEIAERIRVQVGIQPTGDGSAVELIDPADDEPIKLDD